MGQQVSMTYVRLPIFEPQTEAKHNLNTFFYVLNVLPISKLTNHHLNATTAPHQMAGPPMLAQNLLCCTKSLTYPGPQYYLWPSMPLRLGITSIKPSNKQTCL